MKNKRRSEWIQILLCTVLGISIAGSNVPALDFSAEEFLTETLMTEASSQAGLSADAGLSDDAVSMEEVSTEESTSEESPAEGLLSEEISSGEASDGNASADDTFYDTPSSEGTSYVVDFSDEFFTDDFLSDDSAADSLPASHPEDMQMKTGQLDPAADPEELYADYAREVFGYGNAAVYANLGTRLTGLNLRVYQELHTFAANIAAGVTNNTQFSLSLSDLGLADKRYYFSELGLDSSSDANAIQQALANTLGYDPILTMQTAIRDYPNLFYWAEHYYYYNSIEDSYNIHTDAVTGEPYLTLIYGASFDIPVVSAYSYDGKRNTFRTRTTKTGAANRAVQNAQSIVAAARKKSDLNKLIYYRDQVIALTDYNYDAIEEDYDSILSNDEGNPWQLVWVFDGDPSTKVVCEGYSKAYQYLCDITDFDSEEIWCYSVTGLLSSSSSSGGHMWNIIHMDDHRNYMIDVTNCDLGGSSVNENLFMKPPVSGNAVNGYVFRNSYSLLKYTYFEDTMDLFLADDLTLSASAYSPVPKIRSALLNSGTISLVWDDMGTVPQYRLFRKQNNGPWTAIAVTDMPRYSDSDIAPGNTYTYTVQSIYSSSPEDVSAYDPVGCTVTYLKAPVMNKLSPAADGLHLSWNAVSGTEKYAVFRRTPDTDYSRIAVTASTGYLDKTVVSGQTYTYTVCCISSDGSRNLSDQNSSGLTLRYIRSPLLQSLKMQNDSVKLTWEASAGAAGYRVFRKIPGGSWISLGDTAATEYTDQTVASGNTYTYTVRCISATGNSYTSLCDSTGLSIRYLAAPVMLSASCSEGGVSVKWSASSGSSRYRLFRRPAKGGSWKIITDTKNTAFVDTTAASGTAYYYTAACINDAGNSLTSGFDTKGIHCFYVAAPVLRDLSILNGGVQLRWLASQGAQKYRVFRKTAGGSWTPVCDTTALSFTDRSVTSNTRYTYTVRCISATGATYTSFCDTTGLSAVYLAPPVLRSAAPTYQGVLLKWDSRAGAAKYRVFRKTPGGSWTALADTATSSYIDKTAFSGTQYIYTVRCVNAASTAFTSSYNASGISIRYIAAPELNPVYKTSAGIQLTWHVSGGAESYRIFRKTNGGSWVILGDTTSIQYHDTAVIPGNTYTYTVRCMDASCKAYTSSFDPAGVTLPY